jgi:DNA-binding transcriptional MerR regulator
MAEYFMPISELSKKLDIPAHTLRFWEKEFPSLIAPTTGAGGRRYYKQATVDNIFALKKYLYAEGYTIDGVKKLISMGQFQTMNNAADRFGALDEAIGLLTEAKAVLTNKIS